MNGKIKPYAILIFGAPMCGKTHFADQFSQKFNTPFINADQLRNEYKASKKLVLFFIEQLAKTKQNIVIEGLIDTERQRRELRNLLQKYGYRPILVWIQTDISTIKQRLKKSLKSIEEAKRVFNERTDTIEAPNDQEEYLVISGKHTFDTQLKTVLTRLSKS